MNGRSGSGRGASFTRSPAYGARGTRADSVPLPAGSIARPEPVFKALNLTQAVIDGVAVLFGAIFFVALFGSLPLAIGLMIFGAKFH
jgi:hypothetical protein